MAISCYPLDPPTLPLKLVMSNKLTVACMYVVRVISAYAPRMYSVFHITELMSQFVSTLGGVCVFQYMTGFVSLVFGGVCVFQYMTGFVSLVCTVGSMSEDRFWLVG